MLVHASTDDDGLRWKHAFWNVALCSLFLIALQRLFPIAFSGEGASACLRVLPLVSKKNFNW